MSDSGDSSSDEEKTSCAVCGKSGFSGIDLKVCGGCSSVAYCTVECQRKDWKQHKKSCKKTPKPVAAASLLRPSPVPLIPGAASSYPAESLIGRRARAVGLISRPTLNGRVGYIRSVSAAAADRFRLARNAVNSLGGGGGGDDDDDVRVIFQPDDPRLGPAVSLRPASLELLDSPLLLAGIDDSQVRDWPHRPSIDPPSSFFSLWTMPTSSGTPGSVTSGPCFCRAASCRNARNSCGACIHDPVICWSCRSIFGLHCVGGGPDSLTPSSAAQSKSVLEKYASCPLCVAPLGASAMPTIFRHMLGSVLSGDGTTPQIDFLQPEHGKRALLAELSFACRDCDAHPTVGRCTRVIWICNMMRSACAKDFAIVCGKLFKAHKTRAVLEGDRPRAASIAAYISSFRPPNIARRFSAGGSLQDSSHLSRSDIASVWPPLGEGVNRLFQLVGTGSSPPPAFLRAPLPLADMDSSNVALSYQALGGEAKSMNFWLAIVNGLPLLPSLFDFRWVFPTDAAAEDFYGILIEAVTEESNLPPPYVMVRTSEILSGLPTSSSSCLVLRAAGLDARTSDGMSFLNVIFRCGRTCAKVFVCVLEGSAADGRAPREESAINLSRLAEAAAKKVFEAGSLEGDAP